jgi:hypothetical protein
MEKETQNLVLIVMSMGQYMAINTLRLGKISKINNI